MKGVPIKFRGKPTLSSEYIYGDYVTRQDGCAIRFVENENLFNMHVYEVDVKPESVSQLICYDAEGNEVYEGDTIDILSDANPSFKYTFKAELTHNVKVPERMAYYLKFIKRGNTNE